MQYFTLIGYQHVVLAVFLGLLAAIFVYVSWRYYPESQNKEQKVEEIHKDHDREYKGIPPILFFVYGGVIMWVVGYFIIKGIFGGAIG